MKLEETITQILTEAYNTAAFRDWFGKSKMHTNGVPDVFYHGTSADFSEFSDEHLGKGVDAYGSGHYFTDSPEVAGQYTSDNGGNIKKVHLRLEKPIINDDERPFTKKQIENVIRSAPNHIDHLYDHGDVSYEGYGKVLKRAVDAYADHSKFMAMNLLHNDFYPGETPAFMKNMVRHTGYDGVLHTNPVTGVRIATVFRPNQVKSAIANNGDYSRKSNNINETVEIHDEDWLHVENRKPMTPNQHIADIVAEHKKLGYTMSKEDEHILTSPCVTARGGMGCGKAVAMKSPDGTPTFLHIKFPVSNHGNTTEYKIKREKRILR